MMNLKTIDPIYGENETEQEGDHLDIASGNDISEPDPEDTTLEPTYVPDADENDEEDEDE